MHLRMFKGSFLGLGTGVSGLGHSLGVQKESLVEVGSANSGLREKVYQFAGTLRNGASRLPV